MMLKQSLRSFAISSLIAGISVTSPGCRGVGRPAAPVAAVPPAAASPATTPAAPRPPAREVRELAQASAPTTVAPLITPSPSGVSAFGTYPVTAASHDEELPRPIGAPDQGPLAAAPSAIDPADASPLPCPIAGACLSDEMPWSPPGIGGLWPPDEYVCDGGDRAPAVRITVNDVAQGVNPEDTFVRYDNGRGTTGVTPSNCICLYAPRFAAIRKIYGARSDEQRQRLAGVEKPTAPVQTDERSVPTTVVQPLQPGRNQGVKVPLAFRERTPAKGVDNLERPGRVDDEFLPYENFLLIRRGQYDASEKARLTDRIQAALTWSSDQGPQVLIDGVEAVEAKNETTPQLTYTYELRPGKPVMRLCKVASQKEAQPGDLVEFTLRFDNVGADELTNVTVVDNLTTRLEYVPGSWYCSLPAEFFSQANEGESLTLQWKILQPIQVGEGGVIRFRCKVR